MKIDKIKQKMMDSFYSQLPNKYIEDFSRNREIIFDEKNCTIQCIFPIKKLDNNPSNMV